MDLGSVEAEWHEYSRGWNRKTDEVIGEAMVTIYVNGVELATIMCTPREQNLLGLGFLKNEGIIDRFGRVSNLWYTLRCVCQSLVSNRSYQFPGAVFSIQHQS